MKITAIPEAPFRRTLGRRAGRTTGSSCAPSKLGMKSICSRNINSRSQKIIEVIYTTKNKLTSMAYITIYKWEGATAPFLI